jgi:hypothetical protein
MSKDNTVIVIPCVNGKFYVKNVQASENLTFEPNVVPVNGSECYYNLNVIYEYFIRNYGPISTETFLEDSSMCAFHTIVADNKDDAIKVANIMCSNEERDMGWGPEYGIHVENRVVPFDIEALRNIFDNEFCC